VVDHAMTYSADEWVSGLLYDRYFRLGLRRPPGLPTDMSMRPTPVIQALTAAGEHCAQCLIMPPSKVGL